MCFKDVNYKFYSLILALENIVLKFLLKFEYNLTAQVTSAQEKWNRGKRRKKKKKISYFFKYTIMTLSIVRFNKAGKFVNKKLLVNVRCVTQLEKV